MTLTSLSEYFEGAAAKRLSAVEADSSRSNQHEFNASKGLTEIMGPDDREKIPAVFIWIDDENGFISEEGYLTWYDARRRHPTRSEYRLYFPSNTIMIKANEGDAVFFALRSDGSILTIITPKNSTSENQIAFLFGLQDQLQQTFRIRDFKKNKPVETDFAIRMILAELGLETTTEAPDLLQDMLDHFGKTFPSTKIFSKYARSTLPNVSAIDDPDTALISWLEQEELLFRTLERNIVQEQINKGFNDVDEFVTYSLSVQNRRKSRAGHALENQLEEVFRQFGVKYVRGAMTEKKSKPDFLFPSEYDYKDPSFLNSKLTMLGAKTSCKDRWRQILTEAERIKEKHLITLEPSISIDQTTEMASKNIQLIVPTPLQITFTKKQKNCLINLSDFLGIIAEKDQMSQNQRD